VLFEIGRIPDENGSFQRVFPTLISSASLLLWRVLDAGRSADSLEVRVIRGDSRSTLGRLSGSRKDWTGRRVDGLRQASTAFSFPLALHL
jgi:hypothetical protein